MLSRNTSDACCQETPVMHAATEAQENPSDVCCQETPVMHAATEAQENSRKMHAAKKHQ